MSEFLRQTVGSILGAVSTTTSALGNLSSEIASLAGGPARSTTNSSMHIDTVHLYPFEGRRRRAALTRQSKVASSPD